MPTKNRIYIERLKEFEEKGYFERPPVSLNKICEENNIEVKKEFYSQDISGKIIIPPTQEKNAIICINVLHSIERQRFTIAHELGHWFLHRNDIGDGLVEDGEYRSGLSKTKERDADRFAADILMPAKLVNKEAKYIIKKKKITFPFEETKIEKEKDALIYLIEFMSERFMTFKLAMSFRMGLQNFYHKHVYNRSYFQ